MQSLVGRRRAASRERGFTLLEILVALTLMGVILLTAFATFNATFMAYLKGRDFTDEQQNARFLLEWMVRRIRVAGLSVRYAPNVTPAAFTQAGLTSVAFVGDADGDGTVRWYRYCLDTGSGVVRQQREDVPNPIPLVLPPPAGFSSCATGAPLTSSGMRSLRVVSLGFRYFRGDGNELPAPVSGATNLANIARVRITLGLDTNRSTLYEGAVDLTFVMNAVVRD